MKPNLVKSNIARFIDLLRSGSESWREAGRLLCEMVDADPNIYDRIIAENPGVKLAALETLEQIGRHDIDPNLLLDNKPAIRRVLELPPAVAHELIESGVPVVVKDNGGSRTVTKKLDEMTLADVRQVFNQGGVRRPEAQVAFMREREAKQAAQERLRYIIEGDEITFLEDCHFSLTELLGIVERLQATAKSGLADTMRKNQIKTK